MEISEVTISLRDISNISNVSEFEVKSKDDITNGKFGGPYNTLCLTCDKSRCKGHNGYIKWNKMIFNPLFLSRVKNVCKNICIRCDVVVDYNNAIFCRCNKKINNNYISISKDLTYVNIDDKIYQSEDIYNIVLKYTNIVKKYDGLSAICMNRLYIPYNITIQKEEFMSLLPKISKLLIEKNKLSKKNNIGSIVSSIMDVKKEVLGYGYVSKSDNTSSIITSISGKTGYFRGKLLGEDVTMFGRCVMTPSPQGSKIEDVYVPVDIGKSILIPVIINRYNISSKKYTLFTKEGIKISNYTIGDKCFRTLCNGDIVILNRQPTLGIGSIVATSVKMWNNNSIGVHPALMSALRGDYDGDEVNIWALTKLDSIAEAKELLYVDKIIFDENNPNVPRIMPTQDPITSAYFMYKDNKKICKKDFCNIIYDDDNKIDYNKFKDYNSRSLILSIIPSEVMHYDVLNKQTIANIILDINSKISGVEAIRFIERLYNISNKWLELYPFTLTYYGYIGDKESKEKISSLYSEYEEYISEIDKSKFILKRKMNMRKMSMLNDLENKVSDIKINKEISLYKLVPIGIKATDKVISQMSKSLGYITLDYNNIDCTINKRLVPFSNCVDEKLCKGCYTDGLSAAEFIIGSAKARVSINKKNVSTPEAGYLNRDACKHLSPYVYSYVDGILVRNTKEQTRPTIVTM